VDIPQARMTTLNADYAVWYTAFSNTFRPHSPVETREKTAIRHSRITERVNIGVWSETLSAVIP
jgi:hypothetical protein